MKKLSISVLMVLCSTLVAPSFAQFQSANPGGGFTGPGASIRASTVAEILKNPVDDQRVTLRGKIIRQVGDDKYIFTDGTGEIRVDIDQREFPQQPINENTTIEVFGEVDTEFMQSAEIDIKSIRIVQ